jgi:very-short-patch-repair endonuclease
MFLSLVDVPDDGPLPLRQDDRFKQRYNVAASRARDQMWVVYSLDPRLHLKPGDLRRELVEHAEDPSAKVRALQQAEQRVESEFERQVLRHLMQLNYRVRPQWQVGHYRIDLVVEGAGKRLAIECDGDRWHPPDKLGEDLERQAILERLGWTFVRVRGTEFFRDPNRSLDAVFEMLQRLGIPAEGREGSRTRTETG